MRVNELVMAVGTTDQLAVVPHRAISALYLFPGNIIATEGAFHNSIPSQRKIRLSRPPTRKAVGKIKAAIARAVFRPRSLIMIKKLATQGTKRVMVTRLTNIWIGSIAPALAK